MKSISGYLAEILNLKKKDKSFFLLLMWFCVIKQQLTFT